VSGRPPAPFGQLHRRCGSGAALPVHQVLDVFPGGQRAVLSRHLSLELLAGGGAGRVALLLAARRGVVLRLQAGGREPDRRGDDSWSTRGCCATATGATSWTRT
jgi:hypothetical protein